MKLVEIVTATSASFANIDNDERGTIASHCAEIVQNSLHSAGDRFLPCNMDMSIVKACFIHGGLVIPFNYCDERNDKIRSSDAMSKVLQNVYANLSFSLSWGNHFCSIAERERNGVLFCPSATIILSQLSDKWQDNRWVCIRKIFWDKHLYWYCWSSLEHSAFMMGNSRRVRPLGYHGLTSRW